MNVDEVMRVVHDLESWRAVEKDFESRKLIDNATKRLRAAVADEQRGELTQCDGPDSHE
jgi:hypothetical protein